MQGLERVTPSRRAFARHVFLETTEFGLVAFFGVVHRRLPETALIYTAFALTRWVLGAGESWHAGGQYACAGVTLVVMWHLTAAALPAGVCTLWALLIGAMMAWAAHAGYHVRERLRRASASRRELVARALVGMSDTHVDRALLADYVDGMTIETVAERHFCSVATVNRRISAATRRITPD